MQKKQLEKWIWLLIYGGLLGVSLGWFLQPHNEAAGGTLMVAGGAVASVGALLIFVRSRMGP
ncbi:MAG: hypothetical protein Q8L49_10050 [Burkholderiaceae bacterium]|nr:hypothetical protein [Burkholderiaceae bacterium]